MAALTLTRGLEPRCEDILTAPASVGRYQTVCTCDPVCAWTRL